jgi:hypothetical protein
MTANRQEPDIVPDPRWELMVHLQAIAKRRADYQEIVEQHRRLRELVKAEADAQAKLDAIKRQDAQELAELLVNPKGLHETADHEAQGEAEWELMRAKREADVARACEPAVIERQAGASRQIAALEQQVPLMVADIMLDDAHALVAEINADAKRLRAKYARLWGLRRHAGDTPAIRKLLLEGLPLPIHPDNVAPNLGELITAAERWRGYAARLAADPDAEFKE